MAFANYLFVVMRNIGPCEGAGTAVINPWKAEVTAKPLVGDKSNTRQQLNRKNGTP